MNRIDVDQKIYIEPVKLSDAEIVFGTIHRDRNYLRTWLPFVDQTRSKEDTTRYINSLLSEPEIGKNRIYSIWADGEFAGLAGFKDIDPVNHKAEIGYWLAENMQGKGIMTRTVKKLIDFGFRNLKLNRIQIKVAGGNLKSIAIPVRLGLVREGSERNGEFHTDRYFDLEVFSILRNEWAEWLIHT